MAKGKYLEWINPDGLLLIKGWARDGLTDKEIAKNIGISLSTFCEWKNKFPEFSEAIKNGRKPVIIEVEDTFFEKKLKGYYVNEEIEEVTIHPDGGQTKHKRKSKRYIPPDTTAMIFFMKCRIPKKYNEKIALSIENESNGKLSELIEGLKENDLHKETTSTDETMADQPT
ncbi:MAG: helix-turn-helix domain-containing protein [Ruminococcus sp.]|nr:helix-turn-helix domain-containing protein [Ruminococcus sp.]